MRNDSGCRLMKGLTLVLLLCEQSSASQSSTTTLHATKLDPASGTVLRLDRPLSIQVRYRSSQPIRVQACGRFRGKDVRDMSNPSPICPAGEGEALVWIAFRQPSQIDEVLITACDAGWKKLESARVPLTLEWRADAPEHAQEEWVRIMNDAQQQQVATAMRQPGPTGGLDLFALVVFPLMYLSVPGYVILQMLILIRDGFRCSSALPLLVMIPVIGITGYAFIMESNLWPIYLLFCSTVAFFYLAVVFQKSRTVQKSR